MYLDGIDEFVFDNTKAEGDFEIVPFDGDIGGVRLELTHGQKSRVSLFAQNLPAIIEAGEASQTYVMKCPAGLQNTLVKLKDGSGYMNVTRNAQGKFSKVIPLKSASPQAALLGAFSAMSIASGQYFLSQIDTELKMIRLNLDKILEFLYGDKKSELIAELSFAKYAYQNYSSIMAHTEQRLATIVGLQQAKKVAMKDIEFYIGDLLSVIASKAGIEIENIVNKAISIKESLELSMQLFGVGNLLEAYYAQNCDSDYLKYVEADISSYIAKCEKRILSSFGTLAGHIQKFKNSPLKKVDISSLMKVVEDVIISLHDGGESPLRKSVRIALQALVRKAEYYIKTDGSVYLKE